MSTIILIIALVGLILCMWLYRCNTSTLNQRMDIIDIIYDDAGNNHNKISFDSVSYNDHFNAVMLLHNPLNLYSEDIKKAIKDK